ncbi:MAG TPA: epoxide hydrolase [Acidimicrobiales bacterium]|nr:epoxide hydrolase [Acidimicrobiales bacterium]
MTDDIVPFAIHVDDAVLDDLLTRLSHARWPEAEPVDDWSQGVPLDYLERLCRHWSDGYDWRTREERLNRLPQFRTDLEGLGIHFIHVRSPVEGALPLILTHGWPGSVVEFLEVIGPLTDPVTHGGDPADAFHVVCPSLPGYGFSDKPTDTGWGVEHIARVWAQLMDRLGYERYGAQGGDWGSSVTAALANEDPDHVAGIHLNMVTVLPGPEDLTELTEAEKSALESMQHYQRWDSGYSTQQSTRPQTLGYALVDSPVGQCAWILEKFWSWSDTGGDPVGVLGADRILDNVMLYWLPATGASSGRLYWESFRNIAGDTVSAPMGASIFPKEIIRPSRRWAERRFTDIRHWHELPVGGHFAAFEQPEVFVEEVRTFFRTVR